MLNKLNSFFGSFGGTHTAMQTNDKISIGYDWRKFVFIKMLSIVDKDEVKLPPQDIRQLITRKRGNITRHDQTNENTNQ